MDNRKKKVIVVGFNKENGGGAHKDVACTITTGGNAGVAILQMGERSVVSDGKKKSFGKNGRNCCVISDSGGSK